ncbi:MAG: hypothetical protein ACRD9L_28470 [Bryobacteraceae bacterium]
MNHLRKLGEDETVLAVGHASTVPMIIEHLCGGSMLQWLIRNYDRLVVLFNPPRGEAHVVTLRYGKGTE